MKSKILEKVNKELRENATKDYCESNQRFFKENISCYGVKTPIVRKIAKKYFAEVKELEKKEIFNLSEKLLQTDYNEDATIAIQWVAGISERFEKKDFIIFEKWLKKYINNWSKDDDFCLHVIRPMIEKFPELITKLKKWSFSKNMWVRRASAVSFISTINSFYAIKENLSDVLEIAEILLYDQEDLVQKGYGWMLKSASIHYQKEIFNFLMKHKNNMPRTALRYAIEKMPDDLREQVMEK